MKITNKLGLPEEFVAAVRKIQGEYNKGPCDFSATELSRPHYQVGLLRRFWDEVETDVSDLVWSSFGSAFHALMEKGATGERFNEARFFHRVDGFVISGQADLYDPDQGKIIDFKVTTTWSVIMQKGRSEWEEQLNVLGYLIGSYGGKVSSLEDILFFRDWYQSASLRGNGYPDKAVLRTPQPIWNRSDAETWIMSRAHGHARAIRDLDAVEPCNPEERWERPTTYAVIKDGNKRARKVCDTREEAQLFLDAQKGPHAIQERPGERVRCSRYCDVSRFCPIYQEYQAKQPAPETDPETL